MGRLGRVLGWAGFAVGCLYHDAVEQAGPGTLLSYPVGATEPPLIAIDHVLVRNAEARSVRRMNVQASDHHGLLARIVLP
jgi:endonuclease/exonuclease/phosphatase (EEP) superfamily protein YafD